MALHRPCHVHEEMSTGSICVGLIKATLFENMGLMKYEEFLSIMVRIQLTKSISDENVAVIDTDFSDIPVCLYLPKRKTETSYHLHSWWCLFLRKLQPEEGICNDVCIIEDGWEPPCGCWELNSGPLEEQATLFEYTGLMKFEDLFFIITKTQYIEPISDENITVIDTDFSNIPVRLYLPKRKSERQRPAVIYIHGGAFVTGSFKMLPYDSLNRITANRLDAVVVAPDYRLAPQYLFPAALEDCIFVIKFFLQDKVLEKYGVDPAHICISGDSSGGTLAGTVTQLLRDDPEYRNKIKAQAMIYPVLQTIDTWMPSYRENENGPFLSRKLAIKLSGLYATDNEELINAALRNEHMPAGSRDCFKLVNWSDFLPEKYKKNYVYTEPIFGKLNVSYPAVWDIRVSPLLANDSQLQNLPLTYVITCEHDILRDDGLIYVTRLRNAGVPVTHDHIEDGIHGAISFATAPFYLHSGLRIIDKYISWLQENL